MPSTSMTWTFNITGTTIGIDADEDAVKVDNDEGTSVGTSICPDNTMTISAGDDGIHASTGDPDHR